MYVPETTEKKAQYQKLIDTTVNYMNEIDTLREDIKEEKNAAIGMFGCTAKEFSDTVKVFYDRSKVLDQIDNLKQSIEVADSLKA